ncbi:MAG: hypothetical protein CVT49_05255 [candidate division Zixibacteria bacterium HGW-Zixibacteria-1]|nr:MAG: hypothetical protein CVT49_05255 [candidate division Zixibacteria bacterium HGW-Zixibacteria-1]
MPKELSSRKSAYIPPVIFFVISLVFTLPYLLKWDFIGVGDWELFTLMAAVPQQTILHYHQFPFWNPYIGGGNILFPHPEVGILSPFFLLMLIFGAVGGLKLQVLVAYFLGFYGSYLFARKLGISEVGSYLVSFVYFGSSYFALHFSIGHIPFTHFCFLPWFIYFILKVDENWKYIFSAALCIALIIIGNGAAVPLLYTCFFAGLFFLLYSFEKKKPTYFKTYLGAIIIGVLLAAVKFIPMYHYLSQNQWEGMAEDTTLWAIIPKAFFSFNQEIFRLAAPDQYWGWHEYGAYISPLVVILALTGLLLSFKKCRIWLVLMLFFFIFGPGHFSDFSLWGLMHHLPGFSSIRSPARAFQFVILAVAVISAFGLDGVLLRLKLSMFSKKLMAGALVVIIIAVNFFVNLPALKSIAYKKPPMAQYNNEFQQVIGDKFKIYDLFLENKGSLVAPWLSAYKDSRGIVAENNQVFMEYITRGQATISHWIYTPNRVDYDIAPAIAGTIVFSIGFDEGWYSSDSRRLFETNGLVSTDFLTSDRHITLRYRTPYFYSGLILSLLAIAGCLLINFNRNLGKRFKAIFN